MSRKQVERRHAQVLRQHRPTGRGALAHAVPIVDYNAEALLERAGFALDAARPAPNEDNVAHASLAVARAKVLTTEIAIEASNKLFELGGTRSTLKKHNFDRHWRNARVHTLHDPVRWKYHVVGNWLLNGAKPPRHDWS
jgi:alkylation response protein AidB-like acyl-CoA dehydrogenase